MLYHIWDMPAFVDNSVLLTVKDNEHVMFTIDPASFILHVPPSDHDDFYEDVVKLINKHYKTVNLKDIKDIDYIDWTKNKSLVRHFRD